MRRKHNRRARKLAHQVGDYVREHPTALIGGTIAVGFLATRWLMRRNGIGNADAFELTDADRALEFQPRGDRETPEDLVGDPSVRTSVGLDTLAAERERI